MSARGAEGEGERAPRALVLGLGNRNLGDDAIGSCLAEALKDRASGNVDVLDGGDSGIGLLGWLEGYDLVIFLDAVADEEEEVNVYKVEAEGASDEELREMAKDSHRTGPVELALLAKRSGIFEGDAYLVAIKPERVCFMCEPTDEAIGRALRAAEYVNRILERYGFPPLDLEDLAEELIRVCKGAKGEAPWGD